MKKNIIKNKNKLLLSVLIVMLMFFSLFLINTDKVRAFSDEYDYELMNDFTIESGSTLTFNYKNSDVLEIMFNNSENSIIEFSPGEYYAEISEYEGDLEFAVFETSSGDINFAHTQGFFNVYILNGLLVFDNGMSPVHFEQETLGVFLASSTDFILLEVKFYKLTNLFKEKLMIHEIYTAGGNVGAIYKNDFVILYNGTKNPINLANYSLQYASKALSSSFNKRNKLNGFILPGKYFIIKLAGGSNGVALPKHDLTIETDAINMGAKDGRIALVYGQTKINGINDPNVVDYLGYGSAEEFEGDGPAETPSTNESIRRKFERDSDNNITDFKLVNVDLNEYVDNIKKEKVYGWNPENEDVFEVFYNYHNTGFALIEFSQEQRELFFEEGFYQVEILGNEFAEVTIKNQDNNEQIVLRNNDLLAITKVDNHFVLSGSTDFEFYDNDFGEFIFEAETTELTFYRLSVDVDARPVIFGQEVFLTNIDLEKNVEYFLDFFIAYDLIDGDVTDSLTIEIDNYTANKRVINIPHKVTIKATDLSENYTYLDFYIIVVDITPPTIQGDTNTVEVSYTDVFDYNAFKLSLNVNDNHSQLDSSDIEIMFNEYIGNETFLGTYTIRFWVQDESENGTVFVKQIKVIDDIAPVLDGPNTITSRITTILTIKDVTKHLEAWDVIDGNITNKIELIEDNYTGKGHKKGNYSLVYQVADNSGNTTTKTIIIQRVDNIPPKIFVTDGTSIRTTPDIPLTLEQIINILTAIGQLNIEATTNVYLGNENYFGNEDQVGVYSVTLTTQSATGVETEHNLSITVMSEEDNDGVTISPAETITDWIKNNVYLFLGIVIAAIAGLYFVFRPKKKRRRR